MGVFRVAAAMLPWALEGVGLLVALIERRGAFCEDGGGAGTGEDSFRRFGAGSLLPVGVDESGGKDVGITKDLCMDVRGNVLELVDFAGEGVSGFAVLERR